MYVYLYDYAESDLKFKSSDATLLLSMIGILNTVGEVLVGKNLPLKNKLFRMFHCGVYEFMCFHGIFYLCSEYKKNT